MGRRRAPAPVDDVFRHLNQVPVEVESDGESTIRPRHTRPAPRVVTARPTSRANAREDPPSEPASAVSAESASTRECAAPLVPASAKKRVQWYLEFANRPATAEVQHGPIPFDVLAEQLVLEEGVVSARQICRAVSLLSLNM